MGQWDRLRLDGFHCWDLDYIEIQKVWLFFVGRLSEWHIETLQFVRLTLHHTHDDRNDRCQHIYKFVKSECCIGSIGTRTSPEHQVLPTFT